jgi:hypothetical protein
MNKSARMEAFVGTLGASQDAVSFGFDPCYLGYFECFNEQRYYEAHDVLEHLWLKDGKNAPDYAFYKGLIQLAGGFVHLKLQHSQPGHPKHGRRLQPARRLFLLAVDNLTPYQLSHGPHYQGVDLEIFLSLGKLMAARIEEKEFLSNPWDPAAPPILPLPAKDLI